MAKRINIIFIAQLIIIGLVITGLLPRLVVPYLALALVVYFLKAPLEELAVFFVRSIPFFVAIPIAANFDSLNTWRILSIIIFLRWLDWGSWLDWGKLKKPLITFSAYVKNVISGLVTIGRWRLVRLSFAEQNLGGRARLSLFFILVLAILSLTQAQSYVLGIKRIIFFANLSLIGIVIHDLVRANPGLSRRLIKNIAVPTVIVTIVGMIQLGSTYFMDIFQFMDYWGNVVERNMYGNAWADIALKANTWFAYFGDKLSLRMFSIFPDSHSFPIFLILGIPALIAISLTKVAALALSGNKPLKALYLTRGSVWVVLVPLAMLAIILSGTRGMWAAGVGAIAVVFGLFWLFRHHQAATARRTFFAYLASYLTLFFLLFALAYPIFASPQFEVSKPDKSLLTKRVRSIINLGETSNARRVEIWRDSVRSIIKRPLLGVGIGNFPVVVGEDLARAKAGSSAHNLYLHIAAEMGIPTLLAALYFLWLLLKKTYHNYLAERDPMLMIFFGASLIFIPWNLIYSLTDVALFDERAFLLFVTTVALIFAAN